VVLSAISFAICSLVLPSVVMPMLFAASRSGSCSVSFVVEVVGLEIDDISLALFWNSFFARPIDLASSGSFCGPQRKITSKIPTTMSHSYPISAMGLQE